MNKIDYSKLPYLNIDYEDFDLTTERIHIDNKSCLKYVKGELGYLNRFDIMMGMEILFDYKIIGQQDFNTIIILAKKNKILEYKIYLKSWLRNINGKILMTLVIWELCDHNISEYPIWSELKIWKWIKKKL